MSLPRLPDAQLVGERSRRPAEIYRLLTNRALTLTPCEARDASCPLTEAGLTKTRVRIRVSRSFWVRIAGTADGAVLPWRVATIREFEPATDEITAGMSPRTGSMCSPRSNSQQAADPHSGRSTSSSARSPKQAGRAPSIRSVHSASLIIRCSPIADSRAGSLSLHCCHRWLQGRALWG